MNANDVGKTVTETSESSPPSTTTTTTATTTAATLDILEHELEWAEDSMEQYHRRNGKIPLRGNLQDDTKHVYSKKWIDESTNHLRRNHQR